MKNLTQTQRLGLLIPIGLIGIVILTSTWPAKGVVSVQPHGADQASKIAGEARPSDLPIEVIGEPVGRVEQAAEALEASSAPLESEEGRSRASTGKVDVQLSVRASQERRWNGQDLRLLDGRRRPVDLVPMARDQVEFRSVVCQRRAELPAGSYTLVDGRTAAAFEFEVDPTAGVSASFDFVTPPLTQVVVFPVRSDGADFDGMATVRGRSGGRRWTAVGQRVEGGFMFTLVEGQYTFEAICRDHSAGRKKAEVARSNMDVIIDIESIVRSSVALEFTDGMRPISLPREWAEKVRLVDRNGKTIPMTQSLLLGSTQPLSLSMRSGKLAPIDFHRGVVGVEFDGKYEGEALVQLFDLDGWELDEPDSVTLALGEKSKVRVSATPQ